MSGSSRKSSPADERRHARGAAADCSHRQRRAPGALGAPHPGRLRRPARRTGSAALDDRGNPVVEGGKASWITADVASIHNNTAAVVRVRTYAIAAFPGALTLNGLGQYIDDERIC